MGGAGEFDNEGDEFFDAGAEPTSPSFMARSMDRAESAQSNALSFADASSETASRAGSFKDAPGPSELWDVKSTGQYCRTLSFLPNSDSSLGVLPSRSSHIASCCRWCFFTLSKM